jgi:hypothetical protein
MQSKKWSVIENIVNVVTGFAIAQLLILYMLPLWGFDTNIHQSLGISAVFTTVSFARGYICRRIFNHYHNPLRRTTTYIRKHYKQQQKKRKAT